MSGGNEPMLVAIRKMIEAHAEAATLDDTHAAGRCQELLDGLVGTVEKNDSQTLGHLLQHIIGLILTMVWYDEEGNEVTSSVPATMLRVERAMDQMAMEAAVAEYEQEQRGD